jgi:hypothetical protein
MWDTHGGHGRARGRTSSWCCRRRVPPSCLLVPCLLTR